MGSLMFLALRIKLPKKVKRNLDKLEEGYVPYDGSAAKHKIPHVTVVPPRGIFGLEDWKRAIRGVENIPTEFKVTGFGSFWDSSKLGFWGNLNADIGIDSPHLTLFDCKENEREVKRALEEYGDLFEGYIGLRLEVSSLAVIERDKGIIYEAKAPSRQTSLQDILERPNHESDNT
ncbi:hypothetical protein AKJ40_00830 [candidate division MSBL1 archaeon SCGC-AAA259M10]|uniref:2'-5' RNA ligase n=1 Tax=candidate division MSBL1 archaeon SCGC-AAA259M10 TaxID=1698270 RepID=A0A133V2Q4_9EURY|nr:hypothetical protein AKJ40_00830 [candidate division MSBL1 archaeon SCGC-AAA259M10]